MLTFTRLSECFFLVPSASGLHLGARAGREAAGWRQATVASRTPAEAYCICKVALELGGAVGIKVDFDDLFSRRASPSGMNS